MREYSGGGNIKEESSSVINGLVHVSQLRTHLVHWKPVQDTYNVLWNLLKVLYLFLALHTYFELQMEKFQNRVLR